MKNKDVKTGKRQDLENNQLQVPPQTPQRSELNKQVHHFEGVFVLTWPDVWSELMLNSKDIKGFPIYFVCILQFPLQ